MYYNDLMNNMEYLKQQCSWLHEEEERVKSIRLNCLRSLYALSGCGIQDCKKALEKTNYNAEDAYEYLRTRGW